MLVVSYIPTSESSVYKAEILQLTILNDDGDILFDQLFKPVAHTDWDHSYVNAISPEDVENLAPFKQYTAQIQAIIDSDNTILSYGDPTTILETNGLDVSDKTIVNVEDMFYDYYKKYVNPLYDQLFDDSFSLFSASRATRYQWGEGEPNTALGNAKAILHMYKTIQERFDNDEDVKREKEVRAIEEIEAKRSASRANHWQSFFALPSHYRKGFGYYVRWLLSVMFLLCPWAPQYSGDRVLGVVIGTFVAAIINPVSWYAIKRKIRSV